MKKAFLLLSFFIFHSFLAQSGTFGKLSYLKSQSMKIENHDEMQKISFDLNDDNVVILNKIPNQSLPDLNNNEYSSVTIKNVFTEVINQMASKIVNVKNNSENTAQLLSKTNLIFTGKVYLSSFTILNKLKASNQEIREIYLTIPDKNESYLIISTSHKYDANFAKKFQTFLNSLQITK